jgi:tetratricopeptide (TPR) repeat protein
MRIRYLLILIIFALVITNSVVAVDSSAITRGEELYKSKPDTKSLSPDELTALGWYYHYTINDNNTAKTLFTHAIKEDETNKDALEGLYIIELMRGNMNDAFNYLITLLNNDDNPSRDLAYLSHIDLFENTTVQYENLPSLINPEPRFTKENPNSQLRFSNLSLDIFYKLGDSPLYHNTNDIKDNGGLIDNWSVIGPFRMYGKYDINYVFPPEIAPKKPEYRWTTSKYYWENAYSDIEGWVYLEDILQTKEGCAYCKTEIDSKGGLYTLVLESKSPVILWVNEQKLYDKNQFKEPGANLYSFNIKLNSGKNTIFLKTLKNSGAYEIQDEGWRFRVRLVPSIYGKPGEFITEYGLGYKWQWIDNQYFENAYHALLLLHDSDRNSAIDIFERLVDERPDYPFFRLLLIYALIKSGDDWQIKMARNELGTVISQMPDCILAREELAVYYQIEEKYQKSIDTYKSIIDDSPDYLSAHLGLSELYLSQGYNKEFFDEINFVNERFPNNPRATENLINYYLNKENYLKANPLIKEYLTHRPFNTEYWEGLAKYEETEGDITGAINTYEELAKKETMKTLPLLEMARLYQRLGQNEEAIRIYDSLMTNFPRCSKAYLMKGILLQREGKDDSGLITKAQELNPSDYWTSDYIKLAMNKQTINPPFSKEFSIKDIKKVEPYKYPQANSVMLFDQTIIEVNDDYTFTETVHNLIQILNQKGRERWGEITVPSGEMVDLLEARTFMPDGRVLEAKSIKNINDTYVISMEGLIEGSVIEVKYRMMVDKRMIDDIDCYFSPIFTFTDVNMPFIKSQFIVSIPKWMSIYFPSEKFRGYKDKTKIDNKYVYVYEMRDVDEIIPESMMPPISNVSPNIYATTLKGFDKLAIWYLGETWGCNYLDYNSRKFTDDLVKDCNSNLNKAKKIYYWVMKSIKGYTGNIYYPYIASSSMYEKTGRPIDRAVLIMVMLDEIGIKSNLVLVNTIYIQEKMWAYPTSSSIDMPLIYIPNLDGSSYYIAPDLEDLTFGDYWSDNYGKRAVLLQDNGYIEIVIPAKPLDRDSFVLSGTFKINKNGALDATGERYFYGLRGTYRNVFRDPKEREHLVELSLGQNFPYLTLIQVDFSNLDNPDSVFSYQYHFVEPNYAQLQGNNMKIPSVAGPYQLSSAFITSPTRLQPIKFNRPETYEDNILVVPPTDYQFSTIPENESIETKFASYYLTYTLLDDGLHINRKLHITGGVAPANYYQEFIKFCQSVDNIEKRYIELTGK